MGEADRVNDEPACASQFLLVETLRDKWKFKGHVVPDCGALSDIHNEHKVAADAVDAAAMGAQGRLRLELRKNL